MFVNGVPSYVSMTVWTSEDRNKGNTICLDRAICGLSFPLDGLVFVESPLRSQPTPKGWIKLNRANLCALEPLLVPATRFSRAGVTGRSCKIRRAQEKGLSQKSCYQGIRSLVLWA